VTGTAVYRDHYIYTRSDLADIMRQAGEHNATLLATTEKDGVRLSDMRQKASGRQDRPGGR